MSLAKNKIVFEDCKTSCVDIESFSVLNNQSILVTGGTGFVGKWIVEMVSYINSASDVNIKLCLLARDIAKFKEEVPHLSEKPFVRFIEQDVRYLHDLPNDIDYIIHAAGSPDNREHVSDPLRTIETFYKGTQSILDVASRIQNLKKIIHLSSHQVYGKNETDQLINENSFGPIEGLNISNCYAESKRIAETLCSYYKNNLRLPIIILRPFAFMGPYQDLEKPWAVNSFIRDAILGGPIRILGNGLTERSYLYASDMAYAILKSLIDGKVGEIYNLGSNIPISLNELALKVQGQSIAKVEILSKSSKENYLNISKLVPNTNKIVKDLNIKEIFTINDSINRTILWNQLSKNN
ncbi:NAD-dependent epimerase/dehydratase family protein [Flavobacterium humidisoli]|uniref:SDR family oxidoreductase n=1 Tax=Flavobacterium humidisoli TaxID=2937442 RepID=A0ABY4LSL1_9FLAO|nr:SDR family oxidoreductase [Flavobacterium humidisoli]UPZ16070.1 SDR family oxidoreductase [Flavobacterium humidisoli]